MSAPGDLIADRYRLVRLVGSGGMGAVWEARDERLARPVALKQLHAQVGVPPAEAGLAEQRAMREARITARLHHPNAVPVFDVVEHEGRPCLVMQYLPSTPLSELLRRDGALDPARVAVIGQQTSSALAAAHAVGIVHRDVKPGNILITEDGSAVLSDFGISHALGDATLTSTGLVHGTPAFLAPEVARGAESGFASDVYSLGATLYTAVEGAPPFGTDPNAMALLHRIASEQPRPVQRAAALGPLIESMLAPSPQDRPAMAEVTRRLRGLVDTGVLPAADPDATVALTAPTVLDRSEQGDDQVTPARPTARVAPLAPTPSPAATVPVSPDGTRLLATPTDPGRADPDDDARRRTAPVVARSVSEAPPGRTPPAERSRRRAGWIAPLVALLAVVVLAGALGWYLLRDTGSAAGPTGGTTAPSSGRTTGSGSTGSARPSASSTPSTSASPTSSPSASATSASSSPSASAGQLAAAISSYYAVMPGDTDAGWQRLTTRYQQSTAGGRSAYDRFWGQVRAVSVQDVSGDPPDQAIATIVYTYDDGRVVTDRTRFGLVPVDGTLEIDSSQVLSSTTAGSTSGPGSSGKGSGDDKGGDRGPGKGPGKPGDGPASPKGDG
ncbi:serine/threonine protein kinase [Friedmanniella endophytica]|uniref:non-specific serine/threonine protein kinase n=1 Tax=Microlunatus kandeliicorticis TaxID=1759536 RepID=A0A7W3P4V6_9ACTN|nr:serine/threonine-protein kinase [Microlunatus kandeliicorticis]MBA8793304.1 serine/threonine protein kinase [Microlunatus kandeliicorticis]